jgi:coenzyme PQQ synthesis protein D (PqqD)
VGARGEKKAQANVLSLTSSRAEDKEEGHANCDAVRTRAFVPHTVKKMRAHARAQRDPPSPLGAGAFLLSPEEIGTRHVGCAGDMRGAGMEGDRLRVSPAVRASVSADGLVLLDVGDGIVLASNPVGARIWQLVEQQRTRLEIARQLAEDYDIPAERAHHDVAAFVGALVARGLVTEEPPC